MDLALRTALAAHVLSSGGGRVDAALRLVADVEIELGAPTDEPTLIAFMERLTAVASAY